MSERMTPADLDAILSRRYRDGVDVPRLCAALRDAWARAENRDAEISLLRDALGVAAGYLPTDLDAARDVLIRALDGTPGEGEPGTSVTVRELAARAHRMEELLRDVQPLLADACRFTTRGWDCGCELCQIRQLLRERAPAVGE